MVPENVHQVSSAVIVPAYESTRHRLRVQCRLVWPEWGPVLALSCKFLVPWREHTEQLLINDAEREWKQRCICVQSQQLHLSKSQAKLESSGSREQFIVFNRYE